MRRRHVEAPAVRRQRRIVPGILEAFDQGVELVIGVCLVLASDLLEACTELPDAGRRQLLRQNRERLEQLGGAGGAFRVERKRSSAGERRHRAEELYQDLVERILALARRGDA